MLCLLTLRQAAHTEPVECMGGLISLDCCGLSGGLSCIEFVYHFCILASG